MSTSSELLPLVERVEPSSVEDVAAGVRGARERGLAVYPLGGETALAFGGKANRDGVGISLAQLNRIVDYPARDMTITVEAGITMATLRDTLAAERQRLPIDVPLPERATLGGVIATNPVGPGCLAHGKIRDHVIGIEAVGADGEVFHGGGRVVKNVAGYDFCKLLSGSLGTLGIITCATLKLKPIPDRTVWLVKSIATLDDAEQHLAALGESQVLPAAVELLAGAQGKTESAKLAATHLSAGGDYLLAARLEGTSPEVAWMVDTLSAEWNRLSASPPAVVEGEPAERLSRHLADFPAAGGAAAVVQASVSPGAVVPMVKAIENFADSLDIVAHAASGVIVARLSSLPAGGMGKFVAEHLRPLAAKHGGNVVILASDSAEHLDGPTVFGVAAEPLHWMQAVKDQFDPDKLLNPGRFVFP